MTSFIITCILGMTPDTSDTHHSEKCKCQQLDYVHPPTNSTNHQKKKEGSRREEKFSYATAPHAAAAAHHVALLHTIDANCEFVQKKPLFLNTITHRFNRTKCHIFNLDLEFYLGFSQIAGLLQIICRNHENEV